MRTLDHHACCALTSRPDRRLGEVVRRIMREGPYRPVYLKRPKRWSSCAGEIRRGPGEPRGAGLPADAPEHAVGHGRHPPPPWTEYCALAFPVVDCFDGMVVSWTLSRSPNADMANWMLADAVATLRDGGTSNHPFRLSRVFVIKPGNSSEVLVAGRVPCGFPSNVPGYLRCVVVRSLLMSHVSLEESGPGLAASTALRIMSRSRTRRTLVVLMLFVAEQLHDER